MIRTVQDIQSYQRSKKLYPEIVKATRCFPMDGRHLKDQLCRSANSIHANIAEGFGRSIGEFKLFLTRALGSNNEIISHLEDAVAVGFMDKDIGAHLVNEYTIIGKQIFRLREVWK